MIIIVVVKPTDIRLVDSVGDTKTVFKRVEISPTAVIGKGLPSAVRIWRSLLYFWTLFKGKAVLVMWLEAAESKYQGLGIEFMLLERPKVERAEIIICWTISGVIKDWPGLGAFEGPTETL